MDEALFGFIRTNGNSSVEYHCCINTKLFVFAYSPAMVASPYWPLDYPQLIPCVRPYFMYSPVTVVEELKLVVIG